MIGLIVSMGDLRNPSFSDLDPEPSGVERARNLLFDQFLRGDFNVRRNFRPLLNEACQLNTLTLTDEKRETEIALRTNLFSLDSSASMRNSAFNAWMKFRPEHGWNSPFKRPTYELEAQSEDRRTMLNVSSKDGAAPHVLFKHATDGLNVNYVRNRECNQLTMSADGGLRLPVSANFFYNFRDKATSFGIRSEQSDRSTRFNVSAKEGSTPTFQFDHIRDGLSINYLRNTISNRLSVSAECSGRMPVSLDVGYDFRKGATTVGANGQLSSRSEIGVGASIGPGNYYDASFYLRVGGR